MKNMTIQTIHYMLNDKYDYVRKNAIMYCQSMGEDVPMDVLVKASDDESPMVREAAYLICKGNTKVPTSFLLKGMKDENKYVRRTAALACTGRNDIAIRIFRELLNDEEWIVRKAAEDVLKSLLKEAFSC